MKTAHETSRKESFSKGAVKGSSSVGVSYSTGKAGERVAGVKKQGRPWAPAALTDKTERLKMVNRRNQCRGGALFGELAVVGKDGFAGLVQAQLRDNRQAADLEVS